MATRGRGLAAAVALALLWQSSAAAAGPGAGVEEWVAKPLLLRQGSGDVGKTDPPPFGQPAKGVNSWFDGLAKKCRAYVSPSTVSEGTFIGDGQMVLNLGVTEVFQCSGVPASR